MRDDQGTTGHPELWVSSLPHSRGPEGNLRLWAEAETILDRMCTDAEKEHLNEAAYAALVDAYNRCIEERRRAEDLFKLHERWSQRRVGGAGEPKSPVAD